MKMSRDLNETRRISQSQWDLVYFVDVERSVADVCFF